MSYQPIFINPPFLQCHGSTIAELPSGDFIVAWFAGTREAAPDTAIWVCRQKDGEWLSPHVAVKCGDVAHWNPVLFISKSGSISLYFKTGRFPDSWDTWIMQLDDFGFPKNQPKMLVSKTLPYGKMTLGPVRGKMIVTSSGAMIAPSSIEKIISRSFFGANVMWESIIHRSKNHGRTWESCVIPFARATRELGGIIQPSVWEVDNGHLVALCRSTNSILYKSESFDDGITWSEAVKTNIPNPNSAVDVATSGSTLVLVYNPIGGNWIRRTPLSISISELDGLVYTNPTDIVDGDGSYSYPAIIATKDGFATTFTVDRKTIGFSKFKVENQNVVFENCPKPYNFL